MPDNCQSLTIAAAIRERALDPAWTSGRSHTKFALTQVRRRAPGPCSARRTRPNRPATRSVPSGACWKRGWRVVVPLSDRLQVQSTSAETPFRNRR